MLGFLGATVLLHRRLTDGRIRKTSSLGDILILVLLWLQLALGLAMAAVLIAGRLGIERRLPLRALADVDPHGLSDEERQARGIQALPATLGDALDCLQRAARANIRLQYDVYHMQIMEGDVARSIARLLPVIGHIQIADNPGRHEPGTGEINYRFLLNHIDRLGYDGWIGLEYKPAGRTEDGLRWITDHGFKP